MQGKCQSTLAQRRPRAAGLPAQYPAEKVLQARSEEGKRARNYIRLVKSTRTGLRQVPQPIEPEPGYSSVAGRIAVAEATQQLVIAGSLRLWDVLLQRWLHDLRRSRPDLVVIAESQTPEVLTRRLIDGTLDVAIMLEPAQLDIMHIREVASLDFVCVSSVPDQPLEAALGQNYVYVDWGLSFGLDHRRAFPDAAESMTRVSHARMALEYITTLGGSAYLPLRMVANDLEFGLLHRVPDAPVFNRQAYATYPVRSSRLELIEQALTLVRFD